MSSSLTKWHRGVLFLAAVLCAAVGYVVVNPFMANGSLFGGPLLGRVALVLPLLPVWVLLHRGTTRSQPFSPLAYLAKVALPAAGACVVAVIALVVLAFALTGELI